MDYLENTSNEMRECIENCIECHNMCTGTIAHLLKLDRKQEERANYKLLLDCAQLCAACADFMLRSSEFQASVCKLCAEICRKCQQLCEAIGKTDLIARNCASSCKKCAESCLRMGSATAAA
jgi:hypothetical protein